eukprot:COSAG05_NODE_2324_length_3235_cov_2.008610_1_plen_89_part_10
MGDMSATIWGHGGHGGQGMSGPAPPTYSHNPSYGPPTVAGPPTWRPPPPPPRGAKRAGPGPFWGGALRPRHPPGQILARVRVRVPTTAV